MSYNQILSFNDILKNQKIYNQIFNKNIIKKTNIDYSKFVVKKPWGYEYVIFQNKSVAITILYIFPFQQTSMHCHPEKDTSLIVLEGEIHCKSFEKEIKRKNGQGIFIPKKVFHQSVNTKKQICIVMEIESPNKKYDLLRYKDKYGRKNLGYENIESFSVNLNNYNYISLDSTNTYHNLTKKFGNSSITFIYVNSFKDIKNINKNFKNSLVSPLSSGALNISSQIIIGKTYEIGEFINEFKEEKIKQKFLLLLTKKNDRLVKGSDIVINTLKNKNINKAFIVAGDSNLHLLDSIGKREDFTYQNYYNEYNASYAALGYSKYKHKPSVIFASSGHSSIKIIEAVYSAYIDSEPLIVISGQATRGQNVSKHLRQFGNKSVDIISNVKSITKYSALIKSEKKLVYHIEKAIYYSMSDRPGPVWLDIPIDILGKLLDENKLDHFHFQKNIIQSSFKNNIKKISNIYKLINKSKRPVILLGYGIRVSNCEDNLRKMIDLLKIPVLTSRRGSDLIESNSKLFFGRPGVYGHRYANIIIQKSDLVISIGSRLSIPLIGRKKMDFARNAKKIVIDVDENELKKNTLKIDIPFNISADTFINLMISNKIKTKQNKKWINECKIIKKTLTFKKENYSHNKGINPYLFINYLSKITPEKSAIFMDGGVIMNYVMQSFNLKKNQRLISASGLDNDGFSLLAAYGLVNEINIENIVVICDQNSLFSCLPEFSKIFKNRTPFKIIVFKNIKYKALINTQKDFFGSRYVATSEKNTFDFVNNLKNFKIDIINIKNSKNYEKKLCNIFDNNKSKIILVDTDVDHQIKPKMGFSLNYSGKWTPKPLEDMFPFLQSKLLNRLMKIK